jgi:nicotinate-nucleotide adenylyltransferase
MCRLAVGSSDPSLGVCTLELERPGPSYTVDTLRRIHADDPDAKVTLIVGADMARTLSSWREPERIRQLARLAVAERDGSARDEVLESLAPLGEEGSTVFIQMAPVEVSSSMVRERVGAGRTLDGLVDPEVARYIYEHGLYGAGRVPVVQVSAR